MRPIAVLLVAAGVVSAASVPTGAQETALIARQNAVEDEAAVETAVEEEEVDVEDEEAVAEEEVVDEEEQQDENEEEQAEEEENNDDNVEEEEVIEEEVDEEASLNFDSFNLSDFVDLGINDILNINDLSLHEANLAAALSGMLNVFGLGNLISVNDLAGLGFQAELQMLLALQQVGNLVSLGRIGVGDAVGVIRNGLVGNGRNFGINGFNLNGLNFQGLGNGRIII